jgi:GT2 family glycosyltransferase
MPQSRVTVIVSPRERFSETERSLLSILSDRSTPFDLVVVDGGSPSHVRDAIARLQQKYGFRWLRTEHVLTPNEARNLAIAEAKTPWLLFVDNDVIIERGWIGRLVAAGEANDAQLVGPLYLQDAGRGPEVHMAGGIAGFVEENGRRRFREAHSHYGMAPDKARRLVASGPVELLEFHCMLAHREVFDVHGPLDEQLLTTMEHVDLCMLVRDRGGRVWHDMETSITYLVPPPFEATDLGYFALRWCEEWNEATMDRFAAKWRLEPDDPYRELELRWARHHREYALGSMAWPLGKLAGRLKYRGWQRFGSKLVQWLEDRYAGPEKARRLAAGCPV